MNELAEKVFDAVKGMFQRSLEPIIARLKALEDRPPPKDGKDGAPGRDGTDGAAGRDGKDADQEVIRSEVAKQVAQIPVPKDGKDGRDGIDGRNGVDGQHGKDGSPGRDGVDGERGEKGDPGDKGEKGDPGRDGIDGKPGRDGTDGKDGAPGMDGKPGERGEKGERGEPGERGEKGNQGERGERGEPGPQGEKGDSGDRGEKGDAGERGRDGMEGAPGRDAVQLIVQDGIDSERRYQRGTVAAYRGGLLIAWKQTDPLADGADVEKCGWLVAMNGIDEEAEEIEGDGRLIRRTTTYTSGKRLVREFKTAAVLDRGGYLPDRHYDKGDGVGFGGSYFIAQKDSPAGKPGESEDWRLSAKRGRDGKDFRPDEPVQRAPVRLA